MEETYEGGKHVVAAVQHVVKALNATTDCLNDDVRKLLSDLETHLSALTILAPSETREFVEIEERLKYAQQKITSWVSNELMLWDLGTEIAAEYVQAVDEVRNLAEHFRSLSLEGNGRHREVIHRAENALHIAMVRLEEETKHILVQSRQSFVPNMLFRSCEENGADEGSVMSAEGPIVSAEDDSVQGSLRRTSSSFESDRYPAYSVHPDAIAMLKSIVNVMFAAGYDKEFCEAFVRTQKEGLDGHLMALGMEKHSIEELLRMDWTNLEGKIKRWIMAVGIFIEVYLVREKSLCDQIFAGVGSHNSICYVDVTKSSIGCLLNFGEAITLGPRRPEKLIYLLSSCEVLEDLCTDIDALFSEDVGSLVREEFHKLVGKFCDAARGTFLEVGDVILSDPSGDHPAGGRLHPLTSYVMNYMITILDHSDTLYLLLQDQGAAVIHHAVEGGVEESMNPHTYSSVACHLRSIASKLESNLEKKSQLYKDSSLRHIFLMNNIHYIAKKVMGSDLRLFLGDKWIRARMGGATNTMPLAI
ncbi:hypothetical protein Ancab_036041 [Ancistrocladus abbreviatus]